MFSPVVYFFRDGIQRESARGKEKGEKERGTILSSSLFSSSSSFFSNHKNKFQKLCAFSVFSAIIFVISRLYGHITGLVLNTKIKTKSQKVQGNVLYYLDPKYSYTKINFKSYVHFKFFLP
jgi:hypothetical protein